MSVRVLTESTCDRCGVVHTEEGARGDCPPVTWAAVSISIRQPGPGWSGGSDRRDLHLCLLCAQSVLEFVTKRCEQTCPHGDRCTKAEHAVEDGCNHRVCGCNEPNRPAGEVRIGGPEITIMPGASRATASGVSARIVGT